jgi:hypothetical protein
MTVLTQDKQAMTFVEFLRFHLIRQGYLPEAAVEAKDEPVAR